MEQYINLGKIEVIIADFEMADEKEFVQKIVLPNPNLDIFESELKLLREPRHKTIDIPGERLSEILVAIADQPNSQGVTYTIEQLRAFAYEDPRLSLDELGGHLWLFNKHVTDMFQDLQKEHDHQILPFQKSSSCTKCLAVNESAKTDTEYDATADLLRRTCRKCSHRWYERPADYKESQEQENTGYAILDGQ